MPPASQPERGVSARLRGWLVWATLSLAGCASPVAPVAFDTEGGEAWTFDKMVSAAVVEGACEEVAFNSLAGSVVAQTDEGRALARLPLGPGDNVVEARCLDGEALRGPPARQRWHVRLTDLPKAWVRTVPSGGGMVLDAGASELAPVRPSPIVAYEWRARPGNPAPLSSLPANGRRVELSLPPVDGEYYVTLRVTDALGRTDESTAVFRVDGGRPEPVDLAREHPAWIDRAVVYGVAPFFFSPPSFDGVNERLDELAALGIDTLWLSPITAAAEDDFGYAVTDHFRLRDGFGSETDLRELVDGAHARGMRVIMDFVPNHVSAQHQYYLDAQTRGRASPYYGFFDRNGAGTATHYFNWDHLINVDYDHPEVRRWMIEAFAHWVREYDVDGFRADAVWGPRQRAPEFWAHWRAELKRIKPDLLLLAEASARDPYYFENGFDVAYDWTTELGDWPWDDAIEDEQRTARLLRAEIAASLAQDEPDALVFRFIENNDTGERFITRYGLPRTRLAAAMLLTLPGVPQIYTGQEVGAEFQPYDEGPPIAWTDSHGLRSWYRRLIALRAEHAALRSKELRFLGLGFDDRLLAYLRPGRTPRESVLVLLNWSSEPMNITVPDTATRALGGPGLEDLLSGERLRASSYEIPLAAYGARILRAR